MTSLRNATTAVAVTALLLGACDVRTEPVEPMQIVRLSPELNTPDAPKLFLNQEVTVYFNHPIDRGSVNRDTFRVVDTNGNNVEGRLRTGLRSVTFEPVPPVSFELDDGSFKPGGSYVLEVAGMPLWNALRSDAGERLAERFACEFDIVTASETGPHPTPFLPEGAMTEPFGLMERTEPQVATEVGVLDLHFNLPVLPTSATLDALQVFEVSGGTQRRIQPDSIEVLGEQRAYTQHYGSTVRLTFAPGVIAPPALHVLWLQGARGETLTDYMGRSLVDADRLITLDVIEGDRTSVLQLGGGEPWHLVSSRESSLQFEPVGTRLEVQCGVEAGAGLLGWLRPRASTTIRVGERFDRGDGVMVQGGPDFEFLGVDVPPGVTLRIESDRPVQMRVIGSVHVRGRLVLATPMGDGKWSHGRRFEQGEEVDLDALVQASGFSLVAGGNVSVHGAVEHVAEGRPGSPLSMVLGGDLEVRGRFPAEAIVGMDHHAQSIRGAIEAPICLTCRMRRGLPTGSDMRAESWTKWIRLRVDHPPLVDVESIAPRGEIEVAMQVAPPHSVDPTRADPEAHRSTPPTLIGDAPFSLPQGSFVRFRIIGRVRTGLPLPSLGGISVLATR